MNIAVINIKDIIKTAIKIGIIIFLIYICMHLIKSVKISNQDKINVNLEKSINKVSSNSYVKVLDISMSLFAYKNNNDSKLKLISNKDILSMRSRYI